MFVNFDILEQKGFKWRDNQFMILLAIKNKQYARLEGLNGTLNDLFKQDYVTAIKGTPTQPKHEKVRLSKKGKAFLRDVQVAGIDDDAKLLTAALIQLYEKAGLKDRIKSKAKVLKLVSWFLGEVEFSAAQVVVVVDDYLNTEDRKYISQLPNLICKPASVFSTKWTLDESKLYSLLTK